MNYSELRQNIVALIEQYAPAGTKFEWDNATRRFGSCRYSFNRYTGEYFNFRITISYPLASRNTWEVVKQTVIHEIAHARTAGHGHDAVWKRECIRLGGNGKRCYTSESEGGAVKTVPTKYIGVCPCCGQTFPRNRRSNGAYHCRRAEPIKWKVNPQFLAQGA